VGDPMAVTQKIFIVEFGQKSRFLFHHTRVTTILSPLKGWVLHIDYMFIHLSCMYRGGNKFPHSSFATPDWTKMMGNEESGQREAHYQREVESIKCEVARLRSARTSVEHQMERERLYSFLWGHCLSTSNWSYTSSFQSWITAAMPSVIS